MKIKLYIKVTICVISVTIGILFGGYFGEYFIGSPIYSLKGSRDQELQKLLARDPNPTFLPNIRDRAFWDGLPAKPLSLSKDQILLQVRNLYPPQQLDVITEQLMFYPDKKELIPVLAGVINKYLDENSLSEPSPIVSEDEVSSAKGNSPPKSLNLGLHLLAFSASLANSISLLDGVLPPELVSRSRQWLKTTVIDQVLSDYQRYQTSGISGGQSRSFWLLDPNSPAIPPCLSNLVYVALSLPIDTNKKTQVVQMSCDLMRDYFEARAADGVSYPGGTWAWANGFYYYLVMIERLIQATQGGLNLYEDPLVQRLLEYPFESSLVPSNIGSESPIYMVFGFNQNPSQAIHSSMVLINRRVDSFDLSGRFKPNIRGGLRFTGDIYYSPYSVNFPKKKVTYPSGITLYGESGEVIVRDFGNNFIFAASSNRLPVVGSFDYSGSFSLFGSCNGIWTVYLGDMGTPPPPPKIIPPDFLLERPLPVVNSTMQSIPKGLSNSKPFNFDNQSLDMDLTPYYDVEGLGLVLRVINYDQGVLTIKDQFESSYPITFETIVPTSMGILKLGDSYSLSLCGEDYDLTIEASAPYIVRTRESSKGFGQQLISISLTEKKSVGYIKYTFKKKTKS